MTDFTDYHAIIVAAGSGSRFGADLPKQFCLFRGRPLLMTTIDRMAEVIGRERITIVIDSKMDSLWKQLCAENEYESPRVVFGGATRADSVRNAVKSLECPDEELVLIHDGARPLLTKALIERMMSIPEGYVGAVAAVDMTDSLRHKSADGRSTPTDRREYVAVQTPQTFTAGTLRKAYEEGVDNSAITDDASAVERLRIGEIALTKGEHTNLKVTNPADLVIAEAIAEHLDNSRGTGRTTD